MSGIVVESATYGTGSTTVDVTKSVTSMIKDGVLSIPSITATVFNVTDPAPGQGKNLRISYNINGGTSLTKTVNDGESFYINAPPQRTASGLQIIKATYGVDGNFTDVTDAIKNSIKNGGIDMTIGFKNLGLPDPNPNKQKQFEVEYTINGAKNSSTLKDGERFKISAPVVTAPTNGTPADGVMSAVGMVFTNIRRFFGFFLYALSFFTCLRFGNSGGRTPMFWGAIGLIPMSGFVILPLYVLVARLFSDTDFTV
jgi:hypothetical protein